MATKRWRMTGAQAIVLPDGRDVRPGAADFDADLGDREDFLVRSGCLAEVRPTQPQASRTKGKE